MESKCVSLNDVLGVLKGVDRFIIKPSHDSEQGRNVKLINTNTDDVGQVLREFKQDFIIQEVVSQSSRTALFHKESLNTFRISTLNLNGKTSLCNILFRCGQGKSVVDNGFAGGLMAGVSPDGRFLEPAYDKFFNRYNETADGIMFQGNCIAEMPQIVEQLLKWHADYLPHIGFVGWDIALDKDENPVMIEVNLRGPGIQFEQLCSKTPLFGDRTDEVMDYVKTRSLKLIEFVSI